MGCLGLVSCSDKKLPVPAPARYLYSRSPRFVQHYLYLAANTDTIRILSAKHGLLDPDEVIRPYDTRISDLSTAAIARWEAMVDAGLLAFSGWDVVSLIPEAYRLHVDFGKFRHTEHVSGGLYSLCKRIGKRGTYRPDDWPMDIVMTFVYRRGRVRTAEVAAMLRAGGYAEATAKAQVYRLLRCPLIIRSGDFVANRYR